MFPNHSSANLSLYVPVCLDLWYICSLYFINVLLLLPLSVYVLSLGVLRRTRATAVSHSDFVTYNMAVCELIGLSGICVSMYGNFSGHPGLLWVSLYTESALWSARMLFPVVTCFECYVAVVHPVVYPKLRQQAGVRFRNIFTTVIWLNGLGGSLFTLMMISKPSLDRTLVLLFSTCHTVVILSSMLFFSLSVLQVLVRPRPGEVGGDGARIHRSKLRAFRTILLIMTVLFLKFGGSLVANVVSTVNHLEVQCEAQGAQLWLALPSALVLPLLFLQRAGKLPGSQHSAKNTPGVSLV